MRKLAAYFTVLFLAPCLVLAQESVPASPAAGEATSAETTPEQEAATPSADVVTPDQPENGSAPQEKELFEGSLDPEMLQDPDVAARLSTEFPVDGEEWKEYPLGILEMEMQEVIEDLSNGKPKPPAHVTQPRILSRLDFMISELEKKCNGGAGSSNSGNKPAERSAIKKGKMQDGEMRAVKKEGDRWANISPKEREKILQSQDQGFPAGYEDVLADYFRKLSKSDQSTPRTSPDAALDKTPASDAENK